jgi:FMN-dependent oxidoreductase (nitrilotriacetate monooxygenase family)
LEAQNFGFSELPARDRRYDYADEVVEAVCRLWESWDTDALVLDKKAGIYADPDKVHYINYDGQWIKTRGPLTVPRSPQGRPVIMQAGSSPRGRDFAARWAEIIFTLQHAKPDMQAFCDDMADRMGKAGRAATDCAILTSVDPIIGETRAIAREKQDYINGLIDPELGIALVSAHIGTDLSHYPLDQPLADIEITQGSRGSFDVILQGTRAGGLTLGEAAKRFAVSELCPQIVGTPADVADQLQDLFESEACDGFVLTPTVFPGTFEQFARAVVPELQARGIFRTDYAATTLRANLLAQR